MVADYDLVILNGRVMDPETMLDAVLNVGVKDGKIAIITKEIIGGRKGAWPLNYGTSVSQEGARMMVLDLASTTASRSTLPHFSPIGTKLPRKVSAAGV